MTICAHCDEVAIAALFSPEDAEKKYPFCCEGCLTVFNILQLKGLGSYYDIKNQSVIYKRRSPVAVKEVHFQYLDDKQFLQEYSSQTAQAEKVMEFYLEGIHCLACLWLIEKLPDILSGVKFSKLNIERSVVTVTLHPGGKFSQVAQELNKLGYRPHPLKLNQEVVNLKIKEERTFLIRIGVAGAASGNIMIYAVSLYGGASAQYAQFFNLLTVLFAFPVLTYSAFPLYQNAWNALKNRSVSIDIPISLSLIVGGIMGLYNLLQGVPDNYFDSLTALVFLLLLSRYFLHKIQEKGLTAQDLHFFYQSESVLKANENDQSVFTAVHPQFIKVKDVLKILPGEFLPCDGVVLEGSSNLNNSLLTGESLPVAVKVGEKVFSGTQNLDQELIIQTEKIQQETRLGGILKNVENGWSAKSNIVNITNRVSKYFTLSVMALALALFVFLYLQDDTKLALERAITLLIVTCPCALALATPLTFTRALSKAAKEGIIIKSDEVIEKVSKIKNIFFDKTGTITHGQLMLTDFTIVQPSEICAEEIIFNLEKRSKHPVATALLNGIKGKEWRSYQISEFKEIIGVGVSGHMEGNFYEINKKGILENGLIVATYQIADTVRDDSASILKNLSLEHFNLKLISGDTPAAVSNMAKLTNLSPHQALASLGPEDKSHLIQTTPHSMMVGDGANDAIALSQADVGVAVLGAMDISLRAADVYLSTPGLAPVEKLLTLSKETMKVVYRNLILSLLYNSLSVTAAFMGHISPLVAAIIMPLSSLTVLVSTIIGTKKLRSLWKY